MPKFPFKAAAHLLPATTISGLCPDLPQPGLPSAGLLAAAGEQQFHCNVSPEEKKNHPTICLSACDRENFSCYHQPWSSFTYRKDVQL